MPELLCATCGKQLSEKHIFKSRKQGRVPKYCSTTCWGKREREHNYDHTFLDQDNELSAYFLGWWTADGHIDKEGMLHITSVDKQLLDDFMDRIHYKNAIGIRKVKKLDGSYRKTQYMIGFAGNATKCIQALGYARGAKGGKEFLPIKIWQNKDLFYHFLRGFVDGDGSIQCKKKGDISLSMVNMSYMLLSSIFSFLWEHKIVEGGYLFESRPDFYKLQFGHWDSVQICQRMYENSTIKLERKYQKYLQGKDHEMGCYPHGNTRCMIAGCNELARVQEFCKKHYAAYYRIGYVAEHKDEINEKNKLWREKNRKKIRKHRREKYAENPEYHRNMIKKYRQRHPDRVKKYKEEYNKTHREKINEQKRDYRQRNLEKVRQYEKEAYEKNRETRLEEQRLYREAHREELNQKAKEYRENNREKIRERDNERYQARK